MHRIRRTFLVAISHSCTGPNYTCFFFAEFKHFVQAVDSCSQVLQLVEFIPELGVVEGPSEAGHQRSPLPTQRECTRYRSIVIILADRTREQVAANFLPRAFSNSFTR